jgi:antitoxin component YwqK of YwqJK toxin-antitoxin module
MKKIKFILIFLFLFTYYSYAQLQQRSYEDKNLKCSYVLNNGRFDGNYVSYYKNGQKKSEGKFENNYRTGIWTVWDSTGRMRMQRVYSDPFTCKRIFPATPNEKPVELLNIPRYTLQYNIDGYFDYFHLKERMVMWARRIWRFITPNENPSLFANNVLFNIIYKNILAKNIIAYDTKNENLTKELTALPDTSRYRVIGFKIYEDYFFDNERLVSESRIISICPVAINKTKKDTVDLCWLYFPTIRKYIAQVKVQQNEFPEKIKTLDDLFFFHSFYGQIYKEENQYDRTIASYASGAQIAKEAERIEINIIEDEHDIWISFTK